MAHAATISIVIPHFKRHDHLRNLLDTVARQDYPSDLMQVIVVQDDSGLDDEFDLKNKFPFVEYMKCYSHVGAACAKNLGVKRARNEWLVFLDDDVQLHSSWLSNMIRIAQNTPHVKCFQSKVVSMQNGDILKSTGGVANEFGYAWDRGVYERDMRQFDFKKKILFASSCAMMIRKDLFDTMGGFDADFFYMGEDYDLGLRLNMAGESIHYVSSALCMHEDQNCGKDKALKEKYYIERNRWLVVLKNYEFLYLLKLLVPMLALKMFKYVSYLFRFKGKKVVYTGDVLKGWIWIIGHLCLIVKKRKQIALLRQYKVQSILAQFDDYKSYLASVVRHTT
ncbi:glycosyltransferase family 2 protein [Candidatus Omnitrophota bacterium]